MPKKDLKSICMFGTIWLLSIPHALTCNTVTAVSKCHFMITYESNPITDIFIWSPSAVRRYIPKIMQLQIWKLCLVSGFFRFFIWQSAVVYSELWQTMIENVIWQKQDSMTATLKNTRRVHPSPIDGAIVMLPFVSFLKCWLDIQSCTVGSV